MPRHRQRGAQRPGGRLAREPRRGEASGWHAPNLVALGFYQHVEHIPAHLTRADASWRRVVCGGRLPGGRPGSDRGGGVLRTRQMSWAGGPAFCHRGSGVQPGGARPPASDALAAPQDPPRGAQRPSQDSHSAASPPHAPALTPAPRLLADFALRAWAWHSRVQRGGGGQKSGVQAEHSFLPWALPRQQGAADKRSTGTASSSFTAAPSLHSCAEVKRGRFNGLSGTAVGGHAGAARGGGARGAGGTRPVARARTPGAHAANASDWGAGAAPTCRILLPFLPPRLSLPDRVS